MSDASGPPHSHRIVFPEALEAFFLRIGELKVVLGPKSAAGVDGLEALIREGLAARERGDVPMAIARIVDAGIPMLSQSVLLKGVNDNADTLEALMRALVEARVKPYYLHHLDKAPGTSHFRRSIAEGQALMRELHARASGLALPSYVLDGPEGKRKVVV